MVDLNRYEVKFRIVRGRWSPAKAMFGLCVTASRSKLKVVKNEQEIDLFPRIRQKPRTGDESLHSDGRALDVSVKDFWRWSSSDLLSNTTRGIFAEFVVANALGVSLDEVRDEWGAFDLLTPKGVKVEVKSAAYIQSWHQTRLSKISFRVPKTTGWYAETNAFDPEPRRQADVYVFALLAHKEQETIDPLDVSQWHFYVLPTTVLNERTRSQHSIALRSLAVLSGGPVSYSDLRNKVLDAAR